MIKKCLYFNGTQTACSLMIDDLVPVAITPSKEDELWAKYDWGYLMDGKKSLYNYFADNLLKKFPEIKGTIFIPLNSYRYINNRTGYNIYKKKIDEKFIFFLNKLSNKFDLAFHGTYHGKTINTKQSNPIKNNWKAEFEIITLEEIQEIYSEIQDFENKSGFHFLGGKYPAYKKNEHSEQIIETLGFKWWASNCEMINKKTGMNKQSYFGKETKILDLPTNLSGDIFNLKYKINSGFLIKRLFKSLKKKMNGFMPEYYINYLISKRLPITIQEHFQNQGPYGRRQTPNIFDDIMSLEIIFGILRPFDIWYTTCNKLCHYLESYDYTVINQREKNIIEIKYSGRWEKMFLSFKSEFREIENVNTKQKYYGIYKNNQWIFNNIDEGVYKLL